MRFALVALAALVLAASCGGDDRLSKEEYVQEADATCREYEEKLRELEQELEQAESPDEIAQVIDRGIPVVKAGIAELRALKPPEDVENDVKRWLELNDKGVTHLEDLRDAAKAGDAQKLQASAQQAQQTEQQSDEVAREIGLEDCAAEG